MGVSLKALNNLSTTIKLQSIKKASDKVYVIPSALSSAIDWIEKKKQLELISRFPLLGIEPTTTNKLLTKLIFCFKNIKT